MTSLDVAMKTPLLEYSKEDVKKILGKYNKTLEGLEEDLKVLKKWLDEQIDIPLFPGDREIVAFLVSTRFSIEETKSKLKMNFTMKTLFPECYRFSTTDPRFIIFAKNYNILPFPKLSPNQSRVHISRPENTKFFDFDIFTSMILHIHELRNLEDFAENIEYIIDLEKASAEMLAMITPKALKKLFLILETVFSNRIAAIHFINFFPYAESFLKLFKATFHPEMSERIMIHESPEKLFEFYPKEILPKDLGGEERSLQELRDDWIKYLAENKEYLDKVQHVRLRSKDFGNVDQYILDLAQSDFKKLDFD